MPLDAEPEADSELGDWLGQTSESQPHLTPSLHAPSFSVGPKAPGLDPVREASSEGYMVSAEAGVTWKVQYQSCTQLSCPHGMLLRHALSLRLKAHGISGSPSCALAKVWSGCREAAMMMTARALREALGSGRRTL